MKDKDFLLALASTFLLKEFFKTQLIKHLTEEQLHAITSKIEQEKSNYTNQQLQDMYISILQKYCNSINNIKKPPKKKKRKR